jgi:hypothetical protein
VKGGPVLNDLRRALGRLRETLSNRAEQAYTDRDAKDSTDYARNFAAGEAHAYGIAEMDVRDAQKERDNEA